jgi:phenylacetate-CoA ligase
MTRLDSVLLERIPRFRPEWRETLHRMREHPAAPVWNTEVGDRIGLEDARWIEGFEEELFHGRRRVNSGPSDYILQWIRELQPRSAYFRERLAGLTLERDFERIQPMERADLAGSLARIIPEDADLDRLVVNPTSGTTGVPLLCPNHPRAVGCYDPMIQFALGRHGLKASYDHTTVAALQVCAQRRTTVYATVHSYLNGAGFAKINLDVSGWRRAEHAAQYIREMAPAFLSGDPWAYVELMRVAPQARAGALLSTALTLGPILRSQLEAHFRCPVVDVYSLNETGPIGYSSPEYPQFFHQLPTDIYLEIVDSAGNPVADGDAGDLLVSGGRNPYLPLLRYRTGDRARIVSREGTRGDPALLFELTEGRTLVFFRDRANRRINPVDVSRILRQFPIVQHELVQRRDFSLELALHIAEAPPLPPALEARLLRALSELFGGLDPIRINYDLSLDGRKPAPYVCELESG